MNQNSSLLLRSYSNPIVPLFYLVFGILLLIYVYVFDGSVAKNKTVTTQCIIWVDFWSKHQFFSGNYLNVFFRTSKHEG